MSASNGLTSGAVGQAEQVGTDIASLLECLSRPGRLGVLDRLAAGITDPTDIADSLDISLDEARSHIAELEAAGLASRGIAGSQVYGLASQAVNLLATAIRPGVIEESGEQMRRISGDVPPPPLACTMCNSRDYVLDVLDDLGFSLQKTRSYHSRIQEMSSQVLTAHEAERKRIARELHDDTAQSLASMIVRLRLLERETTDPTVLGNVEELRELTSQALDSVRRMAMDLRPASLDDLGLVPALDALAARFAENTGARVSVDATRLRRRLPRDVELVLYRVSQEALNNIAKYASAKEARVHLSAGRNHVTLLIQDDGSGFNEEELSRPYGSGLGIFGMRERLALVSGELEVNSAPGDGTRITARVPLAEQRRTRRSS